MVHLTKFLIVASILAGPALAIPVELDDSDIEMILRRDPSFFSKIGRAIGGAVRKVAPVLQKVTSVAKKIAPIASFVPGPIGAAARVVSFLPREELEFYARQINDELAARDYQEALAARDDGDGLEARSLDDDDDDLYIRESDALEVREPAPLPAEEQHPREVLYDDLD
jgi:hypothetical protein